MSSSQLFSLSALAVRTYSRGMRPRAATTALVLIALTGAAAVGWFLGRPALARRHDVAVRRSLYQSLPSFPGAVKLHERSFELKGDGVGTGDYGLTVTYRLATSAAASEVIEFFRANLPTGWTEASDQTCARLGARMPPPPVATVPPGSIDASNAPPTTGAPRPLVLMPQDGELTLFAPDKAPDDEQRWTGVTIKVSPNRGQAERLSLTEAAFACHER